MCNCFGSFRMPPQIRATTIDESINNRPPAVLVACTTLGELERIDIAVGGSPPSRQTGKFEIVL